MQSDDDEAAIFLCLAHFSKSHHYSFWRFARGQHITGWFPINLNYMAEQVYKDSSQKNIIQCNSDEDIKQLMQKFNVSEEDVNVAIQIVGRYREKVEDYLQTKRSPRFYNIW